MCSTEMRRHPVFQTTAQSLRGCIMDKEGIITKMSSIMFTDMNVCI